MIGAGQVWQIASAWVDGIAAGLGKHSPRMHDMIDRRVRAFLHGLARSQTGVHGGRLSRAVENGEFSYRYAAAPRIEAASRPGDCPAVVIISVLSRHTNKDGCHMTSRANY
jgi:hypothetical protein